MNEDTTIQARIRAAGIDLLQKNRGAEDRPDEYYALSVKNVREQGAEFDLCISFLAGRSYCCCEALCHVGVFRAERWRQVRMALAVHGVEPVKPLVVRICSRLEAGARLNHGCRHLPETEARNHGRWTSTVREEIPSVPSLRE